MSNMTDVLTTPESLYKSLDILKCFAGEDGLRGLNTLGAMVATHTSEFFLASLPRRKDMWEEAWFDLHPDATADNFARAARQVYPVIEATMPSTDTENGPAILIGGDPRWEDAQSVEALIQRIKSGSGGTEGLGEQAAQQILDYLAELRVLYVYGARVEENPTWGQQFDEELDEIEIEVAKLEAASKGYSIFEGEQDEEVWIGGDPEQEEEKQRNTYMIGLGAANQTPRQVAEHFMDRGFDGNVVAGTGFTAEWGIEYSITVWTSTDDPAGLMFAIASWLRLNKESAAYVLENGSAEYLVKADDRVESL